MKCEQWPRLSQSREGSGREVGLEVRLSCVTGGPVRLRGGPCRANFVVIKALLQHQARRRVGLWPGRAL